eukprot:sb/3466482/
MGDSPFTIPEGFPELLQDFTVSVLRERPGDVVEYAVVYFTDLANRRNPNRNQNSAAPTNGIETSASVVEPKKSGVKFVESVQQLDEDEGPPEDAPAPLIDMAAMGSNNANDDDDCYSDEGDEYWRKKERKQIGHCKAEMGDSPFTIPEGFPELLQDFTVSVLRERPGDVVEYAVVYFTDLANRRNPNRNQNSAPTNGIETSASVVEPKKSGVKFVESVQQLDEDEGPPEDAPAPLIDMAAMGQNNANDDDDCYSDEDFQGPPSFAKGRRASVSAEPLNMEDDISNDRVITTFLFSLFGVLLQHCRSTSWCLVCGLGRLYIRNQTNRGNAYKVLLWTF